VVEISFVLNVEIILMMMMKTMKTMKPMRRKKKRRRKKRSKLFMKHLHPLNLKQMMTKVQTPIHSLQPPHPHPPPLVVQQQPQQLIGVVNMKHSDHVHQMPRIT
jgi:hypothetical protein